MTREQSYYGGILAEPMIYVPQVTPIGADPDCPPDGWTACAGPGLWRLIARSRGADPDRPPENWLKPEFAADMWRRAVLDVRRADSRAFCNGLKAFGDRILALFEHFGFDPGEPQSSLDLAVSLAARHETDEYGRIPFEHLCQREGVDPSDEGDCMHLALQLAHRHIKGFQIELPKRPNYRYWTIDSVGLFLAIAAVMEHLKQSGHRVSDRKVAEIILDKKRLALIIPAAAARSIHNILAESGNRYKGNTPRSLSDRALRGYLRAMRTAWRDYCDGSASQFQRHLVLEVFPVFQRLADEEVIGQNGIS